MHYVPEIMIVIIGLIIFANLIEYLFGANMDGIVVIIFLVFAIVGGLTVVSLVGGHNFMTDILDTVRFTIPKKNWA